MNHIELERIPKALRDAQSWTVSGTTKIPLDPHALLYSNQILGYKPDKHKLMELNPILTYLTELNNPELKAAIQLTENIPYVIVDVEPEGMLKNNPYFKWPYLYMEYSRNKGMHGILPFNPPKEYDYLRTKFTIKNDLWNSEVLVANGHFATFTFDEIPMDNIEGRTEYAYSEEFQRIFAEHLSELTTEDVEIDDEVQIGKEVISDNWRNIVEEELHKNDESTIAKLLLEIEPLKIEPGDDTSKEEYRKMLQIYGKMIHRQYILLSEGALTTRTIPMMWRLVQELIPARGKHYSQRNSQAYGRVPWIGYVMLNAIEYIRNSSLNDPKLGEWVTKK